jgi:hypothetical protein
MTGVKCPAGHDAVVKGFSGANPGRQQALIDWHDAAPGRPCDWSLRPMPSGRPEPKGRLPDTAAQAAPPPPKPVCDDCGGPAKFAIRFGAMGPYKACQGCIDLAGGEEALCRKLASRNGHAQMGGPR